MEVAFYLSKETYQSLISVNQKVMKNVAYVFELKLYLSV